MKHINTHVDEIDVMAVCLWDDKDRRKHVVATLANGTPVKVVEQTGMYVKLKTKDGKEGWCMKEFVK